MENKFEQLNANPLLWNNKRKIRIRNVKIKQKLQYHQIAGH